MHRSPLALLVLLLVVSACSSGGTAAPAGTVPNTGRPTTTVIEATVSPTTISPPSTIAPTTTALPDPARPFKVIVPSSYRAGTAMPLVILLHGYSFDGDVQSGYFQMQAEVERRGFLYVHPDGTKNIAGQRFWNATDGCCGFGSKVDDVAYLTSIIDQVSATYSVDPKRIFLMGHSNGAFMSYRMACDRADRIAAIATLAGETFLDPSKCAPSQPVSVLHVQGTADEAIHYEGGEVFGGKYPGARQTVSTWATYDGCGTSTGPTTKLDLITDLPGAETNAESFTGCPHGIDVTLWTMNGAKHIPLINAPSGPPPLVTGMLDFLFAHPKP